jgi:dihydrofolate reductase
MGKIFIDVGMSLDGFIAGLNGGTKNPLCDGGIEIHKWLFNQKSFLKELGLGEEGETGKDNDLVIETFTRTGASIMGKRMFEEGEANWPENAPFHCPVYVLTKESRKPWERKGGTTFYFINDGMQSALEKAKKAAGTKDIRISGGANVIQQFLNAGLVDEFTIHLASIFLGKGIRLFDNYMEKINVEITDVINSSIVTHLNYKIIKK